MIENLRRVAPGELWKVICFEADAMDIDPGRIREPPDFCFIDGEHTSAAVLSDFEFCLKVCAPDAAICFHDDWIVWPAVKAGLTQLRQRGIPFVARKLDGMTFGVFLRNCEAAADPYVLRSSQDGLRWIRWRRVRAWVPRWLKAAILSIRRRL